VLLAAWLQHHGIAVSKDIAGQAVHAISREHSFHPIRDYLDSGKWDGIPRIDRWLTTYFGVEESDYSRAVGAKFLIGAVARIYRPGVKNDTCPILEGPQGTWKSTGLRTLVGPEFFTDDIAELGSKDSVMQTRGVWLIELGELDAMTRGDLSRVKAFMSRQVDRIRPPYGKRVIEVPRGCIFAGTVNKDTYLRDETGGRRFWPVKCGAIKIPELARDRDQLWAEARERFRANCTWWFDTQELETCAAQEVQARYEPDPWDELISDWLKGPRAGLDPDGCPVSTITSTTDSVTVTEILIHCLGKRPDTWVQSDQNRVGRALIAKGWKRVLKRIPESEGKREWRYRSPVVTSTAG
jgi:putative DNA primase/helicase